MIHLSDYVDPYIGTISHMLTSTKPEVMLPYGMARSTPVCKGCSDYYCNDVLVGYPLGAATLMPGVDGDFQNTLDHSRENFRCYYLRQELEELGIVAESTVTEHVYLHRFTGANQLSISFADGTVQVTADEIKITLPVAGSVKTITQYIFLRLSCGINVLSQEDGRLVLSIPDNVVVSGGLSLISLESAEKSLALETGNRSFDQIYKKAQEIWDKQLGKITVSGNTEEKKVIFYTALYRAFQRCTNYTERGHYFSYYDGKAHAGTFYTGDGLWDTFRCMHPLQLLVDTRRHRDILESYNLMYKQSGLMPSFPAVDGDCPVMIGFHAASLFADAMAKGIEADYETAYEGIRKNATEQSMMPWCCNHEATKEDACYWEHGFFPALAKGEEETCPAAHPYERRQAVAVTLEHCYDDWCTSLLAECLGKTDDAKVFRKRAMGYKTLYREEIGYMAPKSIDGKWVSDFDPKLSGGPGGRDYTAENNTLTYTWSVFHDPEGLAELMGGKDKAVQKLDDLFRADCGGVWKYTYLGQFPDATGLMGQFAMGNEPSFHIPYLYDYFGAPWKAQKKIRDLMDIWFTAAPTGICGDEDGGAMSSWFVFSAMGFYPVCPGKAEYALGTPLFDSVALNLENGKVFRIESPGAGSGLRYIKEARLNGALLTVPFLTHEQIISGGVLELTMGSVPNKNKNRS